MTGIAAFSQDFEQINEGLCRVDTDAAIPGLTALAESIHAAGAKVSLQLTAGLGRNINVVNPDRPQSPRQITRTTPTPACCVGR